MSRGYLSEESTGQDQDFSAQLVKSHGYPGFFDCTRHPPPASSILGSQLHCFLSPAILRLTPWPRTSQRSGQRPGPHWSRHRFKPRSMRIRDVWIHHLFNPEIRILCWQFPILDPSGLSGFHSRLTKLLLTEPSRYRCRLDQPFQDYTELPGFSPLTETEFHLLVNTVCTGRPSGPVLRHLGHLVL
ncbi:uncharacterized protein LOC143788781 [Ranitomeya variabilis]|uniref:uncharacterized protein LOC143788781 n=1 Tax=Ranitomeya variabilis TaxID=490064 RepID=UPI0040576807